MLAGLRAGAVQCCRAPAQPFTGPAWHCSFGSHMGMVEMLTESSAANHQMLVIVHNCPGVDPDLK